MDIEINLWVVFWAAVVAMIVGMIWHGPLFGKLWMKLAGFTKEDMGKMRFSAMQAIGLGFLSALILSYVLGHMARVYETVSLVDAFYLAFWPWLGFVVTTLANGPLWENRSIKLFLFNISYHFVSMLAVAMVLTKFG